METTIILKGGTPDEIREALQKLAAAGEPGPIQEPQPIQVEVEDIAPLIEPETPAAEPQQEKGKGWHYKARRTCHQWKTNEDALIRELFDRGVSYNGIAEALENKFGFKVSVADIKQRVRKGQ